MASPDIILLLIVDYDAAIGAKTPCIRPCSQPESVYCQFHARTKTYLCFCSRPKTKISHHHRERMGSGWRSLVQHNQKQLQPLNHETV